MSFQNRLWIAVTALALSFSSIAGGKEPEHRGLLGTWQIEPTSSQYQGRAPLQSGTMRFEASPQGIHVTCDVMTAGGIAFHFEYRGPEDGSVHPVTGNPYYDSESTAWSDANTAKRTEIRAGKVIGSSTMTLAADGQSFTAVSQRSAPEDGHLYTSTIVWKRVAGS
jgi:hypothetical protein